MHARPPCGKRGFISAAVRHGRTRCNWIPAFEEPFIETGAEKKKGEGEGDKSRNERNKVRVRKRERVSDEKLALCDMPPLLFFFVYD